MDRTLHKKIDECDNAFELEKIKVKILYGLLLAVNELATKKFVYK